MNEDDLQDVRRQRLASWLADHGGVANIARVRRLKASYQSYLSQVIHGSSFGSRAARTCEERLGMPALWLDATAHNPAQSPPATVLLARDSAGNFAAPGPDPEWPHVGLTRRQWDGLTVDERMQLDAALMAAYAQILKARRLEMDASCGATGAQQTSRRAAA